MIRSSPPGFTSRNWVSQFSEIGPQGAICLWNENKVRELYEFYAFLF